MLLMPSSIFSSGSFLKAHTVPHTALGTNNMLVYRPPCHSSDSPCRFPSFVCVCWIIPSASSFRLFPRVLSSTFTLLELGPDHVSGSWVLTTMHLLTTFNCAPCHLFVEGRPLYLSCRFRKEVEEFSLLVFRLHRTSSRLSTQP